MSDNYNDHGLRSNRTRRGLLRGLGVTAAGSLIAAGAANLATEPTAAVDADASKFDAADTSTVEDNDGEVTAVYVAPEIDIFWENFGDGIDSVEVTLEATVDEQTDEVYSEKLNQIDDYTNDDDIASTTSVSSSFEDTGGDMTIELSQRDITDSGNITEDEFSDGSLDAGNSTTTTVDLELTVDIDGNQNEDGTVVVTDDFDVEVKNPDGETEIDGEATTDAK